MSFPGISGGAQGLVLPEASVLGHTLTPTAHYEIGIALLALAVVAFAVIAPRAPGLALAAAREHPGPALGLGVPVARLRLGAFTASAAIAGLAGALGVELAQVADPSGYGPILSFKLFVAVIVGGARTPLGPVAGLLLISAFSHAAAQVGGLRGLPPGRLEEMLTGYGLLLVLGLGGVGLLPAAFSWWDRRRGSSPRALPPADAEPLASPESARPLSARGLSKRFESLVALDDLDLDLRPGAVHALIGPNGSGKTTALKALSGELRPDTGSIALGDDPLEAANQRERARRGVVGTQQATAVFADLTVLEHTLVGAGLRRRRSRRLPDVLPDTEGAGRGKGDEAASPRSARPGRPTGTARPARLRALGARAAAPHAGLGACDRTARAPARTSRRRRFVNRARPACRPPERAGSKGLALCSSSTTSVSSAGSPTR